ncbi:MAG TPA: sodium:proton antiporter [Herpetosiphonaceae bacterium]|nr:sodium:proton antiporter [Herpetosiphonaceae bacterium]
MTTEILLVFALLGGAAILFATEKVRPDVVAMGVLVSLVLTGLLNSEDAFSAFSNTAVIALGSVFVISEGLAQTGFAATLARRILAFAGESERRLVLLVMLAGAGLSSFMHNTGTAAIFLPAVLTLAHQTGRSPSRLLFPLSIAILAGGSLTLIGTAPNILVNAAMRSRGEPGFGFFGFAPVAAPILLVLIAVTVLLYDRLLPARQGRTGLIESYKLRDYMTELRVCSDSQLVGKKVEEFTSAMNGELRLVSLIRGDQRIFAPTSTLPLRQDDLLLVRGRIDELHDISEKLRLVTEPEFSLSADMTDDEDLQMAEVTLSPRSALAGQTLRSARVQEQFGLVVLAIWRQGSVLARRLRDVPLRFGDILLAQGPPEAFNRVQEERDLVLVREVRAPEARPRKLPLALLILAGVVALTVFNVVPSTVALFLGAGAMVVTGCVGMERAYEVIDWRTLFIVAGMLPLGQVMEETGTARLIAETMLGAVGSAAPVWLLGGVFLVTMLLSEVVSNDVSTLLVAPLAFTLAGAAGYSPLPFLMTVAIAAGSPFITPMSHGPNLLIMGPGNYRFRDFTIVGIPITLIIGVITLLVVPLVFPF